MQIIRMQSDQSKKRRHSEGSLPNTSAGKAHHRKHAKKPSQIDVNGKKKKARFEVPVPSSKILQKYAEGPLKLQRSAKGKSSFKRLNKTLEATEANIMAAATAAAVADEILLPDSSGFLVADASAGERTYRLKQKDMRPMLDANVSRNIMDLYLTKFGPYRVNYSRNGRCVVCRFQNYLRDCLMVLDSC